MNKVVSMAEMPVEPLTIAPADLVGAEINQQITTAKRYPRSVERFHRTAMSYATLSAESAAACLYAVPRANKVIEGPSVRMAEIIMSAWGNCRVGARVVDELQNFVVAQGVFHDLETNSALTIEVQRRITDSQGRRFNADMIAVTGRAACAIARREAIFQGIPRPLWWEAYEAAKAAVIGDQKTLAQRRELAMKAFRPFGVVEAQIFAALKVGGMADIGVEQLATLAGLLNALKSEGKDPEDIFPPAETRAKPPPLAPPTTKPTHTTPSSTPFIAGGANKPKKHVADAALSVEEEIAAYLPDAETPGQVDSLREMFADKIAAAGADTELAVKEMLTARKQELRGGQ